MKYKGEGKLMNQIYLFSKISVLLSVFLLPVTLFTTSCTKSSEFNVGEDFFQAQANLALIDSFKVNLSTVILDSIATSNQKTALAGSYNDNVFGALNCESYFDLTYRKITDLTDNDVYDSAAIVLIYSKYYYGDTTSLMTLSVRQLTTEITPFTDGYLYNNSSFPYSPDAIGSLTFYPQPTSSDSIVRIPINDFGQKLFTMVLNGDDAISTQDLFDSYINGFVLVSDSTKNKAVIGFRAANTSLYLKMYYHFNDQPDKRQETYFAMGTLNHQFNHYRLNLAGTPLSSIKANGNILPSDKTNNEAFMQGITGIMPKVQFPSLPDLFLNQTWNILKAELVIKPAQGTYNIFSLPKNKSLYLYTTNNTNQITGTLMVNSSQYLTATFVNDPVYNENTSYTYDITNYLNNQLSGGFFNTVNGLLIGPSDTKFKTTYDRMVIDTKYPSVYLLIYYLSY